MDLSNIHISTSRNYLIGIFLCLDLSTLKMVHESAGTTLDCANTIHCADLCDIFMDQSIIFQFGKCIHLLFHCSWLLWRLVIVCHALGIPLYFSLNERERFSFFGNTFDTLPINLHCCLFFQLSWYITFYLSVMSIWAVKGTLCRKFVESQ